jgi:hypothetical protein
VLIGAALKAYGERVGGAGAFQMKEFAAWKERPLRDERDHASIRVVERGAGAGGD